MADSGDESVESVEECLENALDYAENDEAGYWIRIALQRLVVDRSDE
ncbi:hypothetical protein [Salarchaeum japonicum]